MMLGIMLWIVKTVFVIMKVMVAQRLRASQSPNCTTKRVETVCNGNLCVIVDIWFSSSRPPTRSILSMSTKTVPFALPQDMIAPASPVTLPKVGQMVSATCYETNRDSSSYRLDDFPGVLGVYAKADGYHLDVVNKTVRLKVLTNTQKADGFHIMSLGNAEYDVKHGTGAGNAMRDRLRQKLAKKRENKERASL